MVSSGKSFLLRNPNYPTEHLYIVIAINKDKALLVNITSKDTDQTCVLAKGDHPFIKHPSCVNYKDAMLADVNLLKEYLKQNPTKMHDNVSPAILQKIKDGAKDSPNFKPEYIAYLQ